MYVTTAQMIERFGQDVLVELTDRADPPAGIIDQAVLDRTIADAGALIDGYISRQYDLPLAAVPPLLVPVAEDIVFFRLHVDGVPEDVRDRRNDAVALLDRIAKGMVKLDIAGAEPAGATAGQPSHSAPDRIFTNDSLKDFTG